LIPILFNIALVWTQTAFTTTSAALMARPALAPARNHGVLRSAHIHSRASTDSSHADERPNGESQSGSFGDCRGA
jgi:hypothetical protein